MKRIIQIAFNRIDKVIVCIFCLYIISISLIGCSSSKTVDNNCIKLNFLDSTLFDDYNLIYFLNNKDEPIYVFSEKTPNNLNNDSNYVRLDSLKLYCIDLIKQDGLFNIHSSKRVRVRNQDEDIIIIISSEADEYVYYKNGKIIGTVCKSNDIKGLFVLKDKTKTINHR